MGTRSVTHILNEDGKHLVSIYTGIAIKLPPNCFGRIAPRSGLALKNGIDVLAGVIDEDYRGEIKVLLINHGQEDFVINSGDRIAQLVVANVTKANYKLSDKLKLSERGAGGFGHTGIK